MNLTLEQRTEILDKVCRLVETKHFNPAMNGVEWKALAKERRDQILACEEPVEENNLATIVGTKTPGRLLSGGAFRVGHGYILGLPVAAYLTWQGRMLENNGISPAVTAELSREALREGRDTQLEKAIGVVQDL